MEPLGAPVVLPPLENASPVVEFTEPVPPTYVLPAPPVNPLKDIFKVKGISPLPPVESA